MSTASDMPELSTDVLIVGAGPAGASLACFLGYYGVKGLIVSRDVTTAPQPRAHYTNSSAWECLRDIGLETEWRKVSMPRDYYQDYRFCFSLAGEDLARMHSFGNSPSRLGDYEEASPCKQADVSQNVGEPILLKFATQHGFQSRFNCKFLEYDDDPTTGLVTSTILDQLTGKPFRVTSRYLCGADGAGSYVARQAEIPFHTISGGGVALNVWYEADLSHIFARNPGMLHACATPHIDSPEWAVKGVSRVVRPYREFIMSMQAAPGVTSIDASDAQVVARLRELIGDPAVEITLKGVYRWRVNESYAEVASKGNVFCLGDAIHRHPPGNGLGSNTCIQDAYNLAWKLAHVLQGRAGPALLASYSAERQPVGQRVVKIANDTLRLHAALYDAMGVHLPDAGQRMAAIAQLAEATPEGARRRAAVRAARDAVLDEVAGLGAEMNQSYASRAVVRDDERGPAPAWADGSAGVRHHVVSTYPGSRLPHAWLGTATFGEKVSTHDLAGKGRFALFTGVGGAAAWTAAAAAAREALGGEVGIDVRCIGPGLEYADMYYAWEDRRGVDEDGAVLVRPDRTVAWRSARLDEGACGAQLLGVMKRVLCRDD